MDVPLAAGFAVVGLALTGLLNALLLRAALAPLARLQEVARRVRAGDLAVRARPSPLADVEVAQLATTLNAILDEVQRHQEQMRALSGRVIRAQEEERQRIARELHDDTGQVLTLLLIRLKLLEGQPGAEALQGQIGELRGLVSGAIDQVRQLALNLRPPSLDQLGLIPALRTLATTFTANTRLPVALELPRTAVRLSPEQTIAVYRVAQEALTNVAKHANATTIALAVTLSGEALRLSVRDDGMGFDPERIARPAGRGAESGPGVGLFGMEERARLVGGTLRITSARGGGTRVTLDLPMAEQPRDEAAGERVGDEAGAAL
jgi:two-component system, NarL family, sensor histidine kinase UhpB